MAGLTNHSDILARSAAAASRACPASTRALQRQGVTPSATASSRPSTDSLAPSDAAAPSVRQSDLGLDGCVGPHTGECELVDGKVAGIAVHTGARFASLAQSGEVLVSSTAKDLEPSLMRTSGSRCVDARRRDQRRRRCCGRRRSTGWLASKYPVRRSGGFAIRAVSGNVVAVLAAGVPSWCRA